MFNPYLHPNITKGYNRLISFRQHLSLLGGLSDTVKLKYKIAGKLRLGKGAVPASIPFNSHGELPLKGMLAPDNT